MTRGNVRAVDIFDATSDGRKQRFNSFDPDDSLRRQSRNVEIRMPELRTDRRGVGGSLGVGCIGVASWLLHRATGDVVEVGDSTTHCCEEAASCGAEKHVEGDSVG